MSNPFKFGTLVDVPYFTDRVKELAAIKQIMDSENHLILISPRRFGKSSLVKKAVQEIGRPAITVNLQQATSVTDLASLLIKGALKDRTFEKLKYYLAHFRVVPVVSTSPFSDSLEVSFQPSASADVVLEDAFALLPKVSNPDNRLIVVLDEFQEAMSLENGIDKKLRAIMQEQTGINYILLGSQESMMTEIFEKKKSPFYHFGQLMRLQPIPETDFTDYLVERLAPKAGDSAAEIAENILTITHCHPYYTQQIAACVWNIIDNNLSATDIVSQAINELRQVHDLDFERLWLTFNKTDRRLLQQLSIAGSTPSHVDMPPSTLHSALQRLSKAGYVIRNKGYEVEDPLLRAWIVANAQ